MSEINGYSDRRRRMGVTDRGENREMAAANQGLEMRQCTPILGLRTDSASEEHMDARSGQRVEGAKTIRVLSIDGGGMRGIYSAQYMETLIQRYATTKGSAGLDLARGFHLIVGTSTGAIIACALVHRVSLKRVVTLYQERGPQIFRQKVPNAPNAAALKRCLQPKHLSKGTSTLKAALTDIFQSTTLGEVWNRRHIALAVPAVEMFRHRAWVFKTPHLCNSRHRDDRYTLVDVCLAATAAPIFRSLALIPSPDSDGHHVFADGGLWANNPVLIGLIDALEMSKPGDCIEIYSLGTCPGPRGEYIEEGDIHRGLRQWGFGSKAAMLALDVQEHAFAEMARMLSKHVERKCRVIRFPHGPVTGEVMKYLDLDETSEKGMKVLIQQAQTDAYEALSQSGDAANEDGQLLHSMLDQLPAVEAGTEGASLC